MRRGRPLLLAALTIAPLLLAAAPPGADAAEAQRTGVLPLPPASDGENGIVGSSAVALGDAIYVLGGRLKSGTYSDLIYRYDFASGQATEAGQFPGIGSDSGGRQSGAAVALGGKIYYFGGAGLVQADINADGQTESIPLSLRHIVEFDPATGQTTKLLDELPQGAWGLGVARWNDVAYLFGGFSFDITNPSAPVADRLDWIVRFDPARVPGAKVERLPERLPYPVQDAAVAVIGSRVYLLGGLSDHEPTVNPCPTVTRTTSEGQVEETPTETCTTNAIVAFDPAAERVRDYPGKLPQRAQFLHAAVVRNRAYIPGGRLSDGTASPAIVEFAPTEPTPVRTLFPTIPQGLFGAPVAADPSGLLHQFGGRTGGPGDLLGSVVRIQPGATKPLVPRSFAIAVVPGGVRLTWEAPVYDGDAAIATYRVYRAATGAEATAPLVELPGSAVSHDDRSGSPGVEYVYRVAAVNAVGEGEAAVATRATDATVPGAVGDLKAYAGNAQVVLRWAAPAETGGANLTGYRVYRDAALHRSLPASARSFDDENLENGVARSYSVRAVNVKGEGAPGPTLTATPAPVPDTPGSFSAVVDGDAVRLAWTLPSSSVDRFTVYRGDVPARLAPVANVTEPQMRDAGVSRGRTYYYAVTASNAIGESPPTPIASVSLVTKPGAPQSVFAAPLEGAVRVTWQAPFDTGEASAASISYYVSRRDPGSDRFRILDTGELRNTSFLDARVTPGLEYAYTVTALNPLASDPSAETRATPRAVVNKLPIAFLDAGTFTPRPGQEVALDASKSTDPDGAVVRYEIDFGDGSAPSNGTSPAVNHTWRADGFFVATLRVWDNRGEASEAVSRTFQVGDPKETPDSNVDGRGEATPTPSSRQAPGNTTPKIPGPGLLAALAVAAAAALVGRRRP